MARLLSTLLVAFAIFCAPVAMQIGHAMASPAMTERDHACEGMAHHSPDKQKSEVKTNCAIACAAIPALQVAVPAGFIFTAAEPWAGPAQRLAGVGPEAAIPPPRTSPAI